MRDQPHAQHLFRDLDGFRRVFRHLDAAAFPAPAGVNLRFHNHAAADLFRRRLRLIHRKRDFAPRHRDSVFGQDRLGLILVNFHGIKELVYPRTMRWAALQWDGARNLAEAFAFTSVAIAYIWLRPLWWSWSLLIPLALVVVSFVWHSETAESLGLSLRAFAGAVVAWRWWLASGVASLIALTWFETATSIHVIYRWCGYACWCVLQQLLFQNMAYRRLRDGLGASWKTSSIAGAIFAAAHIPNPVLVPATFLWGTVSTRLFEARPSVPVLGVTQALLSAMLYVLTPVALNGQFRVGPGYWAMLHRLLA